jgi:hypothetical protein
MLPITPEILSLFGGAATGFIFKYLAHRAEERAQQVELLIKRQEAADASANAAAERVPIDAGKVVRRGIVVAVLFGVILAPFILALIDKPVIVQEITPIKTWLFGLFESGGKVKFYELWGYLLIPEVRQALMAIIGFYFGQSSAKTNR